MGDTKKSKPSKSARHTRALTETEAACMGPRVSAPDGVLELEGKETHVLMPNPEVIANWEPLADNSLVFFKGISLEKQTTLKGRTRAQQ